MKTRNYGALCALTLTLLASAAMVSAQETVAPLIPMAQIEPDPGTAAPRIVVPMQTQLLQNALKKDDWDAVAVAVKSGADVNGANKKGVTALMMAAEANKPSVVQLLLDNGAQAGTLDKKGRSALHYAIPPDPRPKKKKFGFGNVIGALGGAGNLAGGLGNLANIPGLNSLMGQGGLSLLMGNNLTQLLGGGNFNLSGKSGWMAIAGSALQGDTKGDLGVARLLTGIGALNLGSGDWVNLLSSVKGNNAQILGAMANIGAGDNAKKALWSQFLNQASSGNGAGVASLMKDPNMNSLLIEATQGLLLARGELPDNASRSIISALTSRGLSNGTPDKAGKTALQLASERGLGDLFDN